MGNGCGRRKSGERKKHKQMNTSERGGHKNFEVVELKWEQQARLTQERGHKWLKPF